MSISPSRLPWLGRPWQRLLDAALAFVLPEDCRLCGLPAGEWPICGACAAELPQHGDGACPRCGDVSAGSEICGRCLKDPPAFDATRAAFVYGQPVDGLVHGFKYGHQLHLARWFAARLPAMLQDLGADVLVPMPLHPRRLRERGFNQAIEIGRPLARTLGIPMPLDACCRVRDTSPQAGMDRPARLRNLRQAFECRRDFTGRHVLVLDDVMTTGSSIDELARVLKLHGAQQVSACVVARTMSR